LTVQTGPDRGTVLRSGPKSRDRTAYKSVQSGPVSLVRTATKAAVRAAARNKPMIFIGSRLFSQLSVA
jgi:hypothetical protein